MYSSTIRQEDIDAAYAAAAKWVQHLRTCVEIAQRIKSELSDSYISTRINDQLSALCPDGYRAVYRRMEKWERAKWINFYTPDSLYQTFTGINLGGADVKRIDPERVVKFIEDHNKEIERYQVYLAGFYDAAAQYNNLVGHFNGLQAKLSPIMSKIDFRFNRY